MNRRAERDDDDALTIQDLIESFGTNPWAMAAHILMLRRIMAVLAAIIIVETVWFTCLLARGAI